MTCFEHLLINMPYQTEVMGHLVLSGYRGSGVVDSLLIIAPIDCVCICLGKVFFFLRYRVSARWMGGHTRPPEKRA